MYYPILRGRQNELLALRECSEQLADMAILPVIEPVRDLNINSGSVWRCVDQLHAADAPIAIVINPSVGEYINQQAATEQILTMIDEIDPGAHNIRIAVSIGDSKHLSDIGELLHQHAPRAHIYLHGAASTGLSQDLDVIASASADITHLAEEKSRVRRNNAFSQPLARVAKLSDPFVKAKSNSGYPDSSPYQFTDWNVFYPEDGYVGYSDFATIGQEYSTSGFTPRAVAIHLTYLSDSDSTIWIQHFVSESDRDTMANVAAKFGEAVSKLVSFANDAGLSNPAVDRFRVLQRDGLFPGLGVIKRLSLVNHFHVAGTHVA